MRIIAALAALQILLLAFLTVRVMALDERVDTLASAQQTTAAEQPATRPQPQRQIADTLDSHPSPLDEQRLRAVIREELAQFEITVVESAGYPDAAAGGTPGNADDDYQVQLVRDELDFYIDQGTISDAEMAALQQAIARLSPEGRRELLSRLNQALNSGELEGRL